MYLPTCVVCVVVLGAALYVWASALVRRPPGLGLGIRQPTLWRLRCMLARRRMGGDEIYRMRQ